MYLLAIESSCDDMAMALYHREKRQIVAEHTFSQISGHQEYGGVVPEIASRLHAEQVTPVFTIVMKKAGIDVKDISAVAATNKPGLAGALLAGFCFGKALAWGLKVPFVPVNHLEGHIFSVLLDQEGFLRDDIPFPHLALSASGGHSSLYMVTGLGEYEELGSTRDDAAGEAFDKIAKMMRIGYPGGPIIEKRAKAKNFVDFYNYPRMKRVPGDFSLSFSGLKTAVMYDLVRKGHYDMKAKSPTETLNDQVIDEVSSSLLVCIADVFIKLLTKAMEAHPEVKAITFVGGVACNAYIRERIDALCKEQGKTFYATPPRFCTDNGAMIAAVGQYQLEKKGAADIEVDIFD
jgi:N6-L-threonylcarbamoyladenine synthase